ncbi:MAG: radical SAM protein [Desulfuromonadaceae bacterium]|nr:radical SAM protein [Desulfuromonadaceae bacterium]MDD5106901.1 radical SAM protein [Desulfuromonadaceae bacterium]
MNKFLFDIDVVGSCNLKCPSCPQGNIKDYHLTKGQMDPELLRRIVTKAAAECQVAGISLFSWGEPLLHPRIHELVRIVQAENINCYLSSNLNILPNADAIMAANPTSFRISASGFTQEVYGFYHRGGDIEKVKMNMVKLAEAKRRNKAETHIYVCYHRYKYNLREEEMMRDFASSLDIDLQPEWALMFPLEKILGFVDEGVSVHDITEEDKQLFNHLVVPLGDALITVRGNSALPCNLRDETISMDFLGNVQLCCGIFNAGKYTVGNYLDISIDEIQQRRKNHRLCELCMRHGAHLYLTYRTPGIEEIILGNIPEKDAELLDVRREFALKRRQRLLQLIYQACFSRFFTKKQKTLLKIQVDRLLHLADRTKSIFTGRG